MFRRAEEPNLTFKEKLKLFLIVYWRGLVIVLVPIIFCPLVIVGEQAKWQWCAYTVVIMALYWVTECLPLPVTSFIPIVIFPLSGVMDSAKTCRCYMNDTIMMFIGSLFLAYAVEESGLHRRLALFAIRIVGYSHKRLLFAVAFVTMFVSFWITNTAATTMMVPIIFALLEVFEEQKLTPVYVKNKEGLDEATDITTCYFCTATYAASIGGLGTLVGTGTNLVFKGLFTKEFSDAPEYLSFPKFSGFSIPYALVMNVAMYFWMIFAFMGFLRPKSAAAKRAEMSAKCIDAMKARVSSDSKKLGKLTFWEAMVILLFGGAIIMFFSRSPQMFPGWADKIEEYFGIINSKFCLDSSVAMGVSFLMFLCPSTLLFFKHCKAKFFEELPTPRLRSILNWTKLNNVLPYGFTFLLGGGFALSEAAKAENSDLNGVVGKFLKSMEVLPNSLILLFLIVFTILITNIASNVAICNIVTPIAMQLAKEINVNPLWYCIATGFGASHCYLLPIGTPGNLIVASAAKIKTSKMMYAGSGISVMVIMISWLFVLFYAPLIWPDLHEMPSWAKGVPDVNAPTTPPP